MFSVEILGHTLRTFQGSEDEVADWLIDYGVCSDYVEQIFAEGGEGDWPLGFSLTIRMSYHDEAAESERRFFDMCDPAYQNDVRGFSDDYVYEGGW